MTKVSNVISERLKFLDKNQAWLSRKSKISRSYLCRLIKNFYVPQIDTANKIAKALQCRIEDLWIFDDGNSNS